MRKRKDGYYVLIFNNILKERSIDADGLMKLAQDIFYQRYPPPPPPCLYCIRRYFLAYDRANQGGKAPSYYLISGWMIAISIYIQEQNLLLNKTYFKHCVQDGGHFVQASIC